MYFLSWKFQSLCLNLQKYNIYETNCSKDLKLNNPSNQYDTINLVDESPEIEVGPIFEEEPYGYTPSFYMEN